MKKLTIAAAMGLGAGLMFWLDPIAGRHRRQRLSAQAGRLTHTGALRVDRTARDVGHRLYGRTLEARARLRHEVVSDAVLTQRVRTRLGRIVSHPGAVTVVVHEGCVTLGGPILRQEVCPLLTAVRGVRGVRGVLSALQVHDVAGSVSGLQGGRRRQPPSPLGRLFQRFGKRGVVVDKTIMIRQPLEHVFRCFQDFSSFPRFMSHVRSVTPHGDGRFRWVVDGPAGIPVAWDAEITDIIPHRMIVWRSTADSLVKTQGKTVFTPLGDATRIEIHMAYNPVVGILGHCVAKMFGVDPKQQMDDDLVRMKTFLETGRTPRDAAVRGVVH